MEYESERSDFNFYFKGYSSRSTCLSVYDYSRTTGYEADYERYQQLQCYKSMKIMCRFC